MQRCEIYLFYVTDFFLELASTELKIDIIKKRIVFFFTYTKSISNFYPCMNSYKLEVKTLPSF